MSQKMIYNSHLSEIEIIKPFSGIYIPNESLFVPDELNLNFMKGIEIKAKFSFTQAYNSKILFHGKRTAGINDIFIFSEKIPVDNNNKDGGLWFGYLLVKKGDVFYYSKVFEQAIDSPQFQKSYLCNQYLLTLEFNDDNFDLINDMEILQKQVHFQVIIIEENGELRILNPNEGREIAKKLIPQYFIE